MDMGDLADGGRVQSDSLERQLVLKVGCVRKTTPQPIDRLLKLTISKVRSRSKPKGISPVIGPDSLSFQSLRNLASLFLPENQKATNLV